jgi:hypothetical protein
MSLAGIAIWMVYHTKTFIIAKTVLTAGIHIDLDRQFGGSSPALGKFSLVMQA